MLWVNREYVVGPVNFNKYKLLLPKALGSGEFGERLPEMTIAPPEMGHTQSFVSLGAFETQEETESLIKYLKTKFARTMLGLNKVTQDVTARVFERVPSQNFTSFSDIDWSKSVADIDRQLYGKYRLTEAEVAFIESHVEEMS